MASGVGVAVPLSVGKGPARAASMTLVRLGRGEAGREGGSWVTEGVAAVSSAIVAASVRGEFGCELRRSETRLRARTRRVGHVTCSLNVRLFLNGCSDSHRRGCEYQGGFTTAPAVFQSCRGASSSRQTLFRSNIWGYISVSSA